MALSIKPDLTLRTLEQNRLSVTEIDENLVLTQALSLASSNSLIYLSESFSVDSSTQLADPALKSFNSRTIPSFLYQPFENGCGFVFKFSNTDYGYLGSASSTNLWWSVLAGDISYKVLSISQINSATSSTSYPSYNNWDFNLTSLSFTNSTWTVTGTKIMGPTFSDFEPESIFAVGYKSMLTTGPQGATGPGSSLIFQGGWETSPTVYGVDEYVAYGGSTWFTTGVVDDGISPSPTNSNWTLFSGAALIVGTAIPSNSADTGSKGEIRVNNGQYLYIHTGAQWLKSSMTFSTF
jgi:hypothetical protein